MKTSRYTRASEVMRLSWTYRRQGNTPSQALRKAWLLTTGLPANYRFTSNLFDSNVYILFGEKVVGSIAVTNGGHYQCANKTKSTKLLANRKDAVVFATSAEVYLTPKQLPLL